MDWTRVLREVLCRVGWAVVGWHPGRGWSGAVPCAPPHTSSTMAHLSQACGSYTAVSYIALYHPYCALSLLQLWLQWVEWTHLTHHTFYCKISNEFGNDETFQMHPEAVFCIFDNIVCAIEFPSTLQILVIFRSFLKTSKTMWEKKPEKSFN